VYPIGLANYLRRSNPIIDPVTRWTLGAGSRAWLNASPRYCCGFGSDVGSSKVVVLPDACVASAVSLAGAG
jgi:hypothetical protein